MARKSERLEAIREAVQEGDGIAQAPDESEANELDTFEAQDKILNPKTVILTLDDGTKVEVRTELTLKDVLRKRALTLMTLANQLIFIELSKLSGISTDEIGPDTLAKLTPYFAPAALKQNVQDAVADVLAVLTDSKPSRFLDKMDISNMTRAATLVLNIFQSEVLAKNGKPQKKIE